MTYLGPSLRRRKRIVRPWQRVAVALGVSFLVNLLVLRVTYVDWIGKVTAPGDVRPVVLAPLSSSQWQANRGGLPPASKLPPIVPPVVAPPPETPRAPGPVVDVAPSKDSQAPKDARFAAESNNTVEKETRSRYARPGYQNPLPRPSVPSAKPQPPGQQSVVSGGAGSQEQSGDGRKTGSPGREAGTRGQEQLPRQRLALQLDPTGRQRSPVPGERDQPGANAGVGTFGSQGQGGEGGTGPRQGKPGPVDPSKLTPSASFYDQLAGGPAPDHLPDVEEGEATYLNTREWKYASFFNRIKQSVGSNWDPSRELLVRDPTGNVFGYKDRVTVLSVTLNQQGSLTDVQVQKSSGVDFLDRTAVDAFRKSEPFVNPPRGLADQNGQIKFAFGFYLEFGSPGLRLFRGPPLQ
jgi:TonB family protein